MKSNAKAPRWIPCRISGFTLTELLVAMTLSLFIIGGALSVFVSSQETYRTKADLEISQEAIRFGAYTISRIVRSGSSVGNDSDGENLSIIFNGGGGVRDCLGDETKAGQNYTNTFSRFGTKILCNEIVIVDGLDEDHRDEQFSILYAAPANPRAGIREADFVGHEIYKGDLSSVRSVKINIITPAGSVNFVATLRGKIISELGGP